MIQNYRLTCTSSLSLKMVCVSMMQFVHTQWLISLTSITINSAETILFTRSKPDTAELNQTYMAKSRKTKNEYIDDLSVIVIKLADKLTVKEIRQLIAKYS